jgi:hypothetical protein
MKCVADIARKIAGGEPTPAMLKGLESSKEYLKRLLETERAWPTRESLRAALEETASAAETLRRHMVDPLVRQFLRHGEKQARGDEPEARFIAHLDWVADSARTEALKVLTGAGRGKHVPAPEAASCQEICASIVAVAWRVARGVDVAHTNADALKACAGIWELAGGTGRWGDTDAGWVRHLRAAKAAYLQGRTCNISDQFLSVG